MFVMLLVAITEAWIFPRSPGLRRHTPKATSQARLPAHLGRLLIFVLRRVLSPRLDLTVLVLQCPRACLGNLSVPPPPHASPLRIDALKRGGTW